VPPPCPTTVCPICPTCPTCPPCPVSAPKVSSAPPTEFGSVGNRKLDL
jgi:hypothetical protein